MDSDTESLLSEALALGAGTMAGWSPAERQLARHLSPALPAAVRSTRDAIRHGADPLGERYCRLRSPRARRVVGATYTPEPIVRAMVDWARGHRSPERIVDPGAGSGRFSMAAGRAFPKAEIVAVEADPLAAIIARGNLAAAGMAARASVLCMDYRHAALAGGSRTLFIGNPPYVRHHGISRAWKSWLTESARALGLAASQLAGLHVHFLLATAHYARGGDLGAFITSSEWLDTGYGRLVRELFAERLGGEQIVLLEPAAKPFPDAATTAAILYFEVGRPALAVRFRRAAAIDQLANSPGRAGRSVPIGRLKATDRWSPWTRPARDLASQRVALGELCRVHRGQVTGANRVWIAGDHSAGLPDGVLHPAITRARELFAAGRVLRDVSGLRRVIDLPVDLDELAPDERRAVERFLRAARQAGAAEAYVARHRRAWWSVRLGAPAPILCTYMARRAPAFVLNRAGARHINIAHGLYPRQPLPERALERLVDYLSDTTSTGQGRTYAGGLTKFEPGEIERLPIPVREILAPAVAEPGPGRRESGSSGEPPRRKRA